MLQLVPILGVLAGIIIPVSVFIWLYFEGKDKNKTIIKIAKHMDDPSKAEEFMRILDERKKEPIDYRRGGVITMFVGIGIYLLGFTVMGSLFEGIGLLVGTIGVGSIIAGYLYPNTSEELTNAVEKFEEN
ncbi:MAG: DUF6249 domain-containing protein [Candidatus Marinimicrobia bacterium]|jgi:hypothetical protein|nr:DUF6249 domain-containing protein [Candidatus Neomarinimicrobiota bacterium]